MSAIRKNLSSERFIERTHGGVDLGVDLEVRHGSARAARA